MRFIRTWYGIQGSGRLAAYALRWSRMVTEQAKRRARILAFWAKPGTNTTGEAFETSRSTLYAWQASLRRANGQLAALNSRSRAPQQRRSRSWPSEFFKEIRGYR